LPSIFAGVGAGVFESTRCWCELKISLHRNPGRNLHPTDFSDKNKVQLMKEMKTFVVNVSMNF
jgi:hypothetical protein